jgi:hypothetical protein
MTGTPKERLRLCDSDLPKEYLEAIGDVTVSWAYISNLIEVAIWGMLGLSTKQGTALTAPIFFLARLNMFQSIGTQFFEGKPELAAFKKLRTKIMDMYTERNKIEHATWSKLHPEMPVLRVRILKDTKIEPTVVKVEDIQEVGQNIIKLVMKLNDFMEVHIPPPASSSEPKR